MNKLLANNFLIKTFLTIDYKKTVIYNQTKNASKNILRGRYEKKKRPDGRNFEYNETITIVPEEFKDQDEYKYEKKLDAIYKERYLRHQEQKKERLSIKLPKTQENDKVATCVHKEFIQNTDNDMPVESMNDPYEKQMVQCIFCKYNVPLDYKNVQLLQQFVSPQTGLLYRQEVIGLCIYKYKELEMTLKQSRLAGLLPYYYKEKVFINDPSLFDPFKDNLKKIPDSYDKRDLQ